MNFDEFVKNLEMVRGISPLTERILKELRKFCPQLTDDALIYLAFLLTLERDGNTLVSLDANAAFKRWCDKWSALRQMMQAHTASEIPEELPGIKESFAAAVQKITGKKYPEVIGGPDSSVPFIIGENIDGGACLYIQKYFSAKLIIERKIKELFAEGRKNVPESEIRDIQGEVLRVTGNIKLAEEQALAIARGVSDNLIITGGPGTGKTTVVFFILRVLLKKAEYGNYSVYLAAPSGKAADRMQESIGKSLACVTAGERSGADAAAYEKISRSEGSTIHRMLKYRPKDGMFTYNAEHPFPQESIIVIDEASMIDISLFARLLDAIPQGARVFLLGDKDQLPSVDAGAVLGELLAQKEESVVALTESRRFTADSSIGRFARAVNDAGRTKSEIQEKLAFKPAEGAAFPVESALQEDAVSFFELPAEFKKKESAVQKLAKNWAAFYAGISDAAEKVKVPGSRKVDSADGVCNALWEYTERARILCAERSGGTGTSALNELVCCSVRPESAKAGAQETFVGKIVMLNRNQDAYKLYNGDTGVLVPSPLGQGSVPFVMFKKSGNFVFHSLSAFPAEDIDTAFAITVHKSQGSEFRNVLLFLPDNENHPLLTKQIIYTGITRAKKYCTIVSKEALFRKGVTRVLPRDTGIVIR